MMTRICNFPGWVSVGMREAKSIRISLCPARSIPIRGRTVGVTGGCPVEKSVFGGEKTDMDMYKCHMSA